MMDELDADAGKLNIWVRTELNAPAQRAWFTDTGELTGAGQLAKGGRVAADQIKTLPCQWRWKDYGPFLERIEAIAKRADVSPIEFADRQSILLTNPGLGGRLQVTTTCAPRSRSTRRATSPRRIFTAPMPAARSSPSAAATPMSKASAARPCAVI
jgi:hypothetical protein